MEKMQRTLSPEKIERYVTEKLEKNKDMPASALPLDTIEDFVKVIYIRLYGQRKNMKYRIEIQEETEVNGFRFKDFRIWRK